MRQNQVFSNLSHLKSLRVLHTNIKQSLCFHGPCSYELSNKRNFIAFIIDKCRIPQLAKSFSFHFASPSPGHQIHCYYFVGFKCSETQYITSVSKGNSTKGFANTVVFVAEQLGQISYLIICFNLVTKSMVG